MLNLRLTAVTVAASMLFGMAGCGPTVNSQSQAPAQPMPQSAPQQAPRKQGLSTGQKVLLIAGAAAVYYMYKKHQNSQGSGVQGQYYRSKNGGVYYRDKNGKPVWVQPPSQPIQVPAEEYHRVTGQDVNSYDGGVIQQAPAGW